LLGGVLARSGLRGSGGEGGESWPAASYRSVVQLSSSRQHIKMKSLPKTLFSGSENINENDKKKLFVNNFSDNVETVLGDFAWDGKATGIMGLTLSNDNRRVESGRFYTRGTFQERSIKVAASEIWENAHESVTLTIKIPRAEVFRFTDGGLYSQYVDEEAVTYYMHSTVEDRPPVSHLSKRKRRVANRQVLSQAGVLRQQILHSTRQGSHDVCSAYFPNIQGAAPLRQRADQQPELARTETGLRRNATPPQAKHPLEVSYPTLAQARHQRHHEEIQQP
jgi:hypothetical protein